MICSRTSLFLLYINDLNKAIKFWFEFCGNRPTTESVNYLGVRIDANLSWKFNDLYIKLNRTNALFFKIRKYVSFKTLRSHLFCSFWLLLILVLSCLGSKSWQYSTDFNFTKKGVKIPVQSRNSRTNPLFRVNSILKFQGQICLENISFFSKPLNNLSRSIFST